MYRALHDGWTLRAVDDSIADVAASVPGCVHTDLLRAGLIDDPYLADNEQRLGWIGRSAWIYETGFDWTPTDDERADLVCDGLDTVASVTLNGVLLGTTANMHRGYRWPVRELLRPGPNTLRIRFDSPYEYAEEQRAALGARPGPYAEPFNFIRKTASNFGWDWGPTLVTAGIWQPIGIHTWSGARLSEVRPMVSVSEDGTVGRVDVYLAVERAGTGAVSVGAEIAGVHTAAVLPAGQSSTTVSVEVPEPRLWWPRGYGEQPLYDLTVRAGEDVRHAEIGFRTVELDTEAFRFVINGRPVFVKGFNWIPDDCFADRVTEARLTERFTQAVDTGANTLRVWGGGRYESEEFYRLADRLGLLVWQDFLFACAAYPEEEPLRSEVEAEARHQVARLSPHPSLVLWCGNNENIEGEQHWGWREPLAGRSWGAGFYYELLPKIVAELDPTRPYWPGTPYSGSPERDARDPEHGTIHIWTVWNEQDYTHYSDYTPRFVAEFGFQGPPTHATLRRSCPDGPLAIGSGHQKAVNGDDKLLTGLGAHLPQPRDFDDWHYFTQLNQARALTFGVERFRALMPYCMGTIVWQLNDCWPVSSWAAVDGDGRRKPLWYAMRRVYADRLLAFTDDELAVINDTDEPWLGELTLTRQDVDGLILATHEFSVSAAPRSVVRLSLPAQTATATRPERELLVARFDTERALRFFTEDPRTAFAPARFDATAHPFDSGVDIRVTARTLLRELALFPDRLDPEATVDQQLVTLLPGESTTFRVISARELRLTDLTSFPVLRCVNETRP
ncbi:glycosyl hydrolase 2 galactose-binding domain-containing protein [Streptomyces sp. NPDC088387]|uniref:glycoside hydrolase family 2 protein n=1 Tax=Streptomyces sp. NPDC088387 TaxID=3365859 RepID=UPI0037FA3F25